MELQKDLSIRVEFSDGSPTVGELLSQVAQTLDEFRQTKGAPKLSIASAAPALPRTDAARDFVRI